MNIMLAISKDRCLSAITYLQNYVKIFIYANIL